MVSRRLTRSSAGDSSKFRVVICSGSSLDNASALSYSLHDGFRPAGPAYGTGLQAGLGWFQAMVSGVNGAWKGW